MLVMSCFCIIPKEMCYTDQFLIMNMFAVASCGMVKAGNLFGHHHVLMIEYFTLPVVLTQFNVGCWLFQSSVTDWRECIPFLPTQCVLLIRFRGLHSALPPNLLRDSSPFSFAPSVTFL